MEGRRLATKGRNASLSEAKQLPYHELPIREKSQGRNGRFLTCDEGSTESDEANAGCNVRWIGWKGSTTPVNHSKMLCDERFLMSEAATID
ncbi:MAG: hypothetical protein HY033_00225 [Ignavibacteriae bacterium]|nr:hypothetical protein [Ignavibacteria bacterium]MBI3363313.1 hypothetical protein [Ignavibacteriota bacterium]